MLQLDRNAPLGLRERNIAARRQRILDAARELIRAGGVQGLSMRKLADSSGLAVKTLYNLWGGRDAILRALVDQAMDRMDRALEREAPIRDPLERCRAVVTLTIRHLVGDPALSRAMVLAQYQGLGPARQGVEARASRMQSVAIRAAIDQGLLRGQLDPNLLGRQIYHGYEMAHVQWAFGRIDDEGFRARALYGLYLALLGVATEAVRPGIEAELRELERALRETDRAEPSGTRHATA